MKKYLSYIIFSALFVGNASAATYDVTGALTIYAPDNSIISGSSATGSYNNISGVMDLSGNDTLIGAFWAHGDVITVPGTYNMNTSAGPITGIDVNPGQWFGAMYLDWGGNLNIDLAHVWDITNNVGGSISLVSTDVISDYFPGGSGAPGHPSISGPTVGFTYSFDLLLTPVPVPAAIWLFGSGLIGLIGLARKTS